MELTSENVTSMMKRCLLGEVTEENLSKVLPIAGVCTNFGFDPDRLSENEAGIKAMLHQLPERFLASSGMGESFLSGSQRRDGTQWGEQRDVEALFCLGKAIGYVFELLPRELWDVLPGGVPFYVVNDAGLDLSTILPALAEEMTRLLTPPQESAT